MVRTGKSLEPRPGGYRRQRNEPRPPCQRIHSQKRGSGAPLNQKSAAQAHCAEQPRKLGLAAPSAGKPANGPWTGTSCEQKRPDPQEEGI